MWKEFFFFLGQETKEHAGAWCPFLVEETLLPRRRRPRRLRRGILAPGKVSLRQRKKGSGSSLPRPCFSANTVRDSGYNTCLIITFTAQHDYQYQREVGNMRIRMLSRGGVVVTSSLTTLRNVYRDTNAPQIHTWS